MIDPYRMVVVNVIASGVLTLGYLFYRYIFPKKPINIFILLILISLLPLISLLRKGVYGSGDLSINAIKTMALYSAISDGVFLPGWAENLNATFGYPLFIFTYPLPYYAASLLHFLQFSFVDSVKIVLGTSYIASGISMYLFAREMFKKKDLALVSSVFYLFAPYHLVDLHFRVDIGETLAFVFIPLVFLFANKIIKYVNFKWIILEAASIAILILSHQAVSLITVAVLLLYVSFLTYKNLNILRRFIISLLLGLSLSLFYWLPVILEKQYTHDIKQGLVEFTNLSYLIYAPWRLGFLFQGPRGELSFPVGYAHLIIIGIALLLIFLKKIRKRDRFYFIFFLSISLALVFMVTPLSKPIWQSLPLINSFQFSYRFMSAVIFTMAVVAGITAKYIKNRYILFIICAVAIFSTILNWGNRRAIPQITDRTLALQLPESTSMGEGLSPAMPRWLPSWINEVPKSQAEIMSGSGRVSLLKRNSIKHDYEIIAESNLEIKENTAYFPGWTAKLDGKKVSINYENPKYPGIITVKVPEGKHLLRLQFQDTSIRFFSKLTTLLTLLGFFFFFILQKTEIIISKKKMKRPNPSNQ
ncbi:MAG: hypothetical protein A3C27_03775 [Candidatus Levybacteria bacterium RIFCSPHIGHO2_02_FULL_39_36]|nr:MAG: hypothetical protein UT20_C0003G0012 [Candidatus Levybacteria bacterium GW2011_GWA1_39_11]KKR24588.1 MAG: hypothetical protein UT56_C0012G0003 [Candidatus Levybacteria bacterium GW2011_GWB1_39_7]KKR27446.1 MAG: putative membrane spanning protein [Microgenomates group bacterium GW2011_GWC1_39_7]OGH25996.1 MAG: hypothetical protein A3E68_03090 [Candidatus Levybacteria bacterium RIFCSPHIGHO2_12_FULL_39_39]OGH28838.1 MAG: hypothetical protein A3C27_03775 [Candidatus Levybacteria bacterium R